MESNVIKFRFHAFTPVTSRTSHHSKVWIIEYQRDKQNTSFQPAMLRFFWLQQIRIFLWNNSLHSGRGLFQMFHLCLKIEAPDYYPTTKSAK